MKLRIKPFKFPVTLIYVTLFVTLNLIFKKSGSNKNNIMNPIYNVIGAGTLNESTKSFVKSMGHIICGLGFVEFFTGSIVTSIILFSLINFSILDPFQQMNDTKGEYRKMKQYYKDEYGSYILRDGKERYKFRCCGSAIHTPLAGILIPLFFINHSLKIKKDILIFTIVLSYNIIRTTMNTMSDPNYWWHNRMQFDGFVLGLLVLISIQFINNKSPYIK